jgi:preprotein translocase subunit YajC
MRKTITQIELQQERDHVSHENETLKKRQTIAALSQFKEGDRVFNRLTKKHGVYAGRNGQSFCWVRFDILLDEEWFIPHLIDGESTDLLNLELCHCNRPIPPIHNPLPSSVCLAEQLPYVAEELNLPDLMTHSESPNSLNQTLTDKRDLENSTPESHSGTISKPLEEKEGNGIFALRGVPARIFPEPIQTEMDLMKTSQDFGGKCSELSENAALNSSSGKMLKLPDTQHQENNIVLSPSLSGVLPASATFANGLLSAQKPLERPIKENESYLLLPTPMAHSRAKDTYNRPGQDKLEVKLRERGIIPPGEVSTPEFRRWMMGISPDTIVADGGETTHHLQELAPRLEVSPIEENKLPPLEIVAPPNRRRSLGQGSPALSELTIDEEKDRQHLERKVENAFIKAESVFKEAVFALKEIRDRKLYKSTHETFEEYCKERFGFSRRRPYQLIDAAVVLENLEKCELAVHILPSKETHCREIAKLETPEEQREAWEKITCSGEVAPISGIKSIIEEIKDKTRVPLTQQKDYQVGDIVFVKAAKTSTLRPFDGCWGVISDITDIFYHIAIDAKNEVVMTKGDEMKRVDLREKDKKDIQLVSERLKNLAERDDLDPFYRAGLEVMQTRIVWTELQLQALTFLEEVYGINVKMEV